ncbi:MAG: Maf family protein [Planctomycetota bacterium]
MQKTRSRKSELINRQLILASGSPRRKQLLKSSGYRFKVIVSDADESIKRGQTPKQACVELARRKAGAAARIFSNLSNKTARPAVVLGADTIVVVRGEILGKANDPAHARRILKKLSGAVHEVLTGVCLQLFPEGTEKIFAVRTRLSMRKWTAAEIENYISSGEWIGKAGAYAIQETADRFITKMSGSWTNVVGLPMEKVTKELAKLGVDSNK